MNTLSIEILIEAATTLLQTVSTTSITIFHTISNIALSISSIAHLDNIIVWILVLLGSIVMLIRFAKTRKIDFLKSLFNS